MKTKILRAYKMTNGGGVTKQPEQPAGQDRKGLVDYLADAIQIISADSETLDTIQGHLMLMVQTLEGMSGDIAQIAQRQRTAFEIIQQAAGRVDVTDINDIDDTAGQENS